MYDETRSRFAITGPQIALLYVVGGLLFTVSLATHPAGQIKQNWRLWGEASYTVASAAWNNGLVLVGAQEDDTASPAITIANPVPPLPLPASVKWRKSSGFSFRRKHPVFGVVKAHTGLDLAAPKGSPVISTMQGKVIFSGWKGGYGNLVIVQNESGTRQTYYAHLLTAGASAGTQVTVGTEVGKLGMTGTATGFHVHYEVRLLRGGRWTPIDPWKEREDALKNNQTTRVYFTSADWDKYLKALMEKESSGRVGIVNAKGYVGLWQQGAPFLAEAGYIDRNALDRCYRNACHTEAGWQENFLMDDKNWVKHGYALFRSSPELQRDAAIKGTMKQIEQGYAAGILNTASTKADIASWAMAAHLEGGSCAEDKITACHYFRNGLINYASNKGRVAEYAKTGRELFL